MLLDVVTSLLDASLLLRPCRRRPPGTDAVRLIPSRACGRQELGPNQALWIIAGVLAFAFAGSGIMKLVPIQRQARRISNRGLVAHTHQRDSAALLWQVSPRSSVYHRGLAPSCPI